jgi:Protein of unknown function (DUF4245)
VSEQGGGGRYNRSASGLIGSMIVIVLVVIGFVVFRGAFSKDIDEGAPDAIDYLETVEQYQAGGLTVVYPETLPDGWIVTRADAERVERPGDQPALGIDLYTDDDRYVGIKLADEDVDDLLEEYVDDDPAEDDPLTGAGGVAADWEGWSDDGGDHAFTAVYGDRTLLVFGSVSADELADVVGRLTDELRPGVTPLDG